jgi:hypothetical protein
MLFNGHRVALRNETASVCCREALFALQRLLSRSTAHEVPELVRMKRKHFAQYSSICIKSGSACRLPQVNLLLLALTNIFDHGAGTCDVFQKAMAFSGVSERSSRVVIKAHTFLQWLESITCACASA